MFACLLLPACASTVLQKAAEPVLIEQDCETLTLDESLLELKPVTPLGPILSNGDLEDAFETVVADGNRDRGDFQALAGAVRQRDHNQAELDKICARLAQERAEEIRNTPPAATTIKRPLWKSLGFL